MKKYISASNLDDIPSLSEYRIRALDSIRYTDDKVSPELMSKLQQLSAALNDCYNLYYEQIAKPKEEAKREAERKRKAETGITIPLTQSQADLCSVVLGQLSDGYWENTPYYEPFWKNMDVEGTNLVIDMEKLRYAKYGDRFKKDIEELSTPEGAKRWFAKKAQIVQNEDLKYEFGTTRIKGHEDEQANYLDRGVNQTFGQVQEAINSLK